MSGSGMMFVTPALGWTLVHFLWQGALLAACLWTFLSIARNASANVRYLASCLTLGLMLLATGTTFIFELHQAKVQQSNALREVQVFVPGSVPFAAHAPSSDNIPNSVLAPANLMAVPPPGGPIDGDVASAPSPSMLTRFSTRMTTIIAPWLGSIVGIWLLGVGCLTVRLFVLWTQVRQLRKRTEALLDGPLLATFERLREQLGIGNHVAIRLLANPGSPMVVGWLRPIVIVPTSLVTGLPPGQLEAMLAHELMHIRRHDYLINLLQSIVEVLLFYHPAVWWVSKVIRSEREHCCDDGAAALYGKVEYAHALASLAERQLVQVSLGMAAGNRSLLQRIRRLAGADKPSSRSGATGIVLTLLLMAGVSLAVLSSTTTKPAVAAAPLPPATEEPPTTKPAVHTITITGRAINEQDQPIAGVQLWLTGHEMHEHSFDGAPVLGKAVTDANGNYEMSFPSTALDQVVQSRTTKYPLWAWKEGWALTRVINKDLPTEPVIIPMESAPVVEFQLQNPDGTPAANVAVTPQAIDDDGYYVLPNVIRPLLVAQSNKDGRAPIRGIPHHQFNSLQFARKDLGVQSYTFFARDRQMPTRLTLRRVGELDGRLHNLTGSPIDLSKIHFRLATISDTSPTNEEYWAGIAMIRPDSDGHFHVPTLVAGAVRVFDLETHGLPCEIDLSDESSTVTADATTTFDIPLREAVRITQVIRDYETQRPVPGVRILLNSFNDTNGKFLRSDNEGKFSAWVGKGMRYLTEYLPPDDYFPVSKDSFGPLAIAAQELPPIDLIHRTQATGIVLDEQQKPISDATVHVDWDSDLSGPSSVFPVAIDARYEPDQGRVHATTRADGRFLLTEIPRNVELTLAVRRAGLNLAPPTTIIVRDESPIQLVVPTSDCVPLRGRVVDSAGAGAPNMPLVIRVKSAERAYTVSNVLSPDRTIRTIDTFQASVAVTDATGSFETPSYFRKDAEYQIAVQENNRDRVTSGWLRPADTGGTFPDLVVVVSESK